MCVCVCVCVALVAIYSVYMGYLAIKCIALVAGKSATVVLRIGLHFESKQKELGHTCFPGFPFGAQDSLPFPFTISTDVLKGS